MLEVVDYRAEFLTSAVRAFDSTWGWELRGEAEEKLSLAAFYVSHALLVSNVRRIALIDGRFAGLMFGMIPSLAYSYGDEVLLTDLMKRSADRLSLTATGRNTLSMYQGIDAVNARLLTRMRERGLTWQATMNLLIAVPEFLGQGAGRALVSSFFEMLSAERVSHVILYTDDHCNYRYYDKTGWERGAEADWVFEGEPIHAIAYRKAVR